MGAGVLAAAVEAVAKRRRHLPTGTAGLAALAGHSLTARRLPTLVVERRGLALARVLAALGRRLQTTTGAALVAGVEVLPRLAALALAALADTPAAAAVAEGLQPGPTPALAALARTALSE